MRTGINLLFAFLLVAGLVVPASNAQTVEFIGAGSSAMWQEFALAAVNDPLLNGPGSHHWTTKGKCPDGSNCAQAFDSRSGPGGSVSDHQGGNLWVVWNAAQTRVWAYLAVDSVVGNRLFFASPRAALEIDSNALKLGSSLNLINPALFKYGSSASSTDTSCPAGVKTCDDSSLPTKIFDALNNAPITAAMTDIRPEDALFASNRVNCPPPVNLGCLGYGNSGKPVGNGIQSAFSSSEATPVKYAITGSDPVSGDPIPAWSTYPVGAQPIIILVNRSNTATGLGQTKGGKFVISNVTHSPQLQTIFSGANCSTSVFAGAGAHPIFPILREPMSGTMNTFEFTNLTNPVAANGFPNSQETNVGTNNPLETACSAGGGKRYRAIGTGEEAAAVLDGDGSTIFNGVDSIGYVFFSYGNVSKLAGNPSYGYLTLDGVDPLVGNPGHTTNGELPVCALPCPAKPNTTFINLRKGNYRSFSFVRLVTDTTGALPAANLVKAAQTDINLYVPDFVPYVPANGDEGMQVYRSHFTVPNTGIAKLPNNGITGGFHDPSGESGGDVGGCIELKTTNVLGQHENVTGGCAK
jgi:hypothetical protein